MHKDLKPQARQERALQVYRARVGGAAILGLAALAYLTGRVWGIW